MKAAIMRDYGGPEVLELAELPVPTPGPGEVVVKVLAAGLNRLDHYLREGSVTRDLPLPHILGSDAAAEIAAVGAGVDGFAPGDRAVPMPGHPLDPTDGFEPISAAPSYAIRGIVEPGAYAQFMRVPAKWVVPDRTGLSPAEVATLPMALVTTIRALRAVGELTAGETALIHAGASGTGIVAVQVAKALGARVIATVRSPDKGAAVLDAGADAVVATGPGWIEAAEKIGGKGGYDLVLDNLGGSYLAGSLQLLKPLGRLVSMGMVAGLEATIPVRGLFFAQQRILGTLMGDRADLEWGLELVAAGKVRAVVDRVFPLRDAAAAHARLADAAQTGSIVLDPWS